VVRELLEDREIANFVPLAQLGYTVRLITTSESGPYDASGLGVPVTRLHRARDYIGPAPVGRRITRYSSPYVDFEALVGLEKALRQATHVCVNETHNVSSAQACRLAARRPHMRVVTVCYENIPFRYEDNAVFRARKAFVRDHSDLLVALTPAAATALRIEGVPPHKIVVQPYGVDPERFSASKRTPALHGASEAGPDDVVVLFAGRLIQEKGLTNLLLATSNIQHLPVQVVIVGSGPELPRLERAADALRLRKRVTFLPWMTHAEMPALMASADIFAMPSLPTPYWEEQLGFSLIEAMASGVPIISTDSGAIPFVVGEAGILVPPYDVNALSAAVARLINDADLRKRMGDAGRARVEAKLNIHSVARAFAQILNPTCV